MDVPIWIAERYGRHVDIVKNGRTSSTRPRFAEGKTCLDNEVPSSYLPDKRQYWQCVSTIRNCEEEHMKAETRMADVTGRPASPITDPRTASRHARALIVAGVVIVFAAAACNSSGANPSSSAAAATSAAPSTASVAPSAAGEPIKVAQIAAHSGQLAQLGDWDKEALDLAFKEKNDAGGVCGRPLQLDVFDDQGDPTVGTNVTQKALGTGIVAAFATTESAVTLAILPLFQDAKVPHFTAGQSDAITKEGSAYVFRDGPPAAAFNKTLANYALTTKGWTKIAMVTNTGGYGDSERKAFTAQLTLAKLEPLLDATVAPEAQEFTAQINEIKRLQPEAVYTGMEEVQNGLFAKQLREFGITVPLIGGPPGGTPQFVEVAGAAANGSIFSSPYITNEANDQTRAFAAAFKAMHGKDPEFHGAKGYDGAQLLFQAIEATCADITGESIAAALHKISGYQGLQGQFNVQGDGETLSTTQVGILEDGVAKLAE
jgi:branched-chain amino acid transport system substrate-binding protein